MCVYVKDEVVHGFTWFSIVNSVDCNIKFSDIDPYKSKHVTQ